MHTDGMSGHSKWAQIKRQKGVADLKKSATFTKLANAITVAVREGGKDPEMNFRLRLAIEKAREANMPKENVDRAIKRGSGEPGDRPIETVVYEGYGPSSSAIVVETVTDNRNRTTADLRKAFTGHGGALGNTNSVLWMFERRGVIVADPADRQATELAAIDAGAIDIHDDGSMIIFTAPNDLDKVRSAVASANAVVTHAEISLVPKTTVEVQEEGTRAAIRQLILALEDLPDTTNVSVNADV